MEATYGGGSGRGTGGVESVGAGARRGVDGGRGKAGRSGHHGHGPRVGTRHGAWCRGVADVEGVDGTRPVQSRASSRGGRRVVVTG